ncbi:hypothetical protein H2203_000074 [Taxawa tesnikishii (nom. ined.)]|nr:hypothetical protein H2203_000074 [Dothideales sp. JES 119]
MAPQNGQINHKKHASGRVVPAIPLQLTRKRSVKPTVNGTRLEQQPLEESKGSVSDAVAETPVEEIWARDGIIKDSQAIGHNLPKSDVAQPVQDVQDVQEVKDEKQEVADVAPPPEALDRLLEEGRVTVDDSIQAQAGAADPDAAAVIEDPIPAKPASPEQLISPMKKVNLRSGRTELPPAFVPSSLRHQQSHSETLSKLSQPVTQAMHQPAHPSVDGIVFGGYADSAQSSPAPSQSANSMFSQPPGLVNGNMNGAVPPPFPHPGHSHYPPVPVPFPPQQHGLPLDGRADLPPAPSAAWMPTPDGISANAHPHATNGPYLNGFAHGSRPASQASSAPHEAREPVIRTPDTSFTGDDSVQRSAVQPLQICNHPSLAIPNSQITFWSFTTTSFRHEAYRPTPQMVKRLMLPPRFYFRYFDGAVEALRYLYGAPPLDGNPFFGSAMDPTTLDGHMKYALSYAAAGIGMQIPVIFNRGLDIASRLLRWENVETALAFALDGGISPTWGTGLENSSLNEFPEFASPPTYDPFATHFLHTILDFLVFHFPTNFVLERFPAGPNHASRLSISDPRLKALKFGDLGDGYNTQQPLAASTLSTILLDLPFPVLKALLEHPGLGARLGWDLVIRNMHAVVEERKSRRQRTADGVAPHGIWDETIQLSSRHRSGYELVRRRAETDA